jgi:hypothetical protein
MSVVNVAQQMAVHGHDLGVLQQFYGDDSQGVAQSREGSGATMCLDALVPWCLTGTVTSSA